MLMEILLLANHYAPDGMVNSERERPPKKFEDTELQTLLDQDDGQT